MKRFLTCVCWLVSCQGFSQQVVDVSRETSGVNTNNFYTVGGEPFVTTKFVNLVDGSPYFRDDWMSALLIDSKNSQYKSKSVKIDLLDNKIHFLDDGGREMIALVDARQIILTDTGGNNFKFVHSSALQGAAKSIKEGWYLWLASGKASLYKYFTKTMTETRPYNSATYEQYVKTKESYLVYYNNTLIEIKKLKDAPSVLANKKTELENFLKTKDKESEPMDDRFAALVAFYNSLLKDSK